MLTNYMCCRKQMKEELLSKQPSLQDDSDHAPTPTKKQRRESKAAIKEKVRKDSGHKEKCSIGLSPKPKAKGKP